MVKKPMFTLMSDDGEGFTPSNIGGNSGSEIQNWGFNQALNKQTNATSDFFQNFGKPGRTGFLPPHLTMPSPLSPWNIFGQVMKGRRNAVEASGKRFNAPDPQDYYNDPAPNTRWDDQQMSAATGNTLGEDVEGFQNALNKQSHPSNHVMLNLRRQFGLL